MSSSGLRRLELVKRMRRVRLFLYTALAVAGYHGMLYPPEVLLDSTERVTAVICAGFWALGGTWCVISVLRRSVGGEFMWLRPISLAVCAFSLALLAQVPDRGPALGVYALLMLAFGISLWGWWHLVSGLIGPLMKEDDRGSADS